MIDAVDPLAVLLELTRRLGEDVRLEECLQLTSDAALALLAVDHVSIRVLDDSRKKLLCGARSGTGLEKKPLTFRPGEGVAGWVVSHGCKAFIPDVLLDPRFVEGDQSFEIRSLLAVPLVSSGRQIGVLSASSPIPGVLRTRDEQIAELLANCVSPHVEKARLERLAVTDAMTLAFNVRYLKPRLQEEIARAARTGIPFSFLAIDLDHFKAVNDLHGHQAGDRVLRGFAGRVRLAVRRPDVMVRRGGDEFVLLMPATEEREAEVVASRILDRLAEDPILVGANVAIHQGASMGIATWDGRETADELEQRADAALYRAKQSGRNRIAIATRRTFLSSHQAS